MLFRSPLSLINRDNYMMRSFSLGGTVVADLQAPLRNKLDTFDLNNDGQRHNQLAVDQSTFLPQFKSTKVVAVGGDVELKLLDTRNVDWKTYVDFSTLHSGLTTDAATSLDTGDLSTRYVHSGGFTWGHLLRMNFGEDRQHALRVVLEGRRYDRNYLPSYFDVMYEVQRMQYALGRTNSASGTALTQQLANGTKLQTILGRSASGPQVNGFYVEASWKVLDKFALAFALEANDTFPDNNFFVHLEVPRYKNFQFLATLHRRSLGSVSELFKAKSSDKIGRAHV